MEHSRLAQKQLKDMAERKLREKEYRATMLGKLKAEGIYRCVFNDVDNVAAELTMILGTVLSQ